MSTLALLPNLAGGDGLIIFVIILLLFGAKKLPELARGLGSAVREFSKAKDEIEHEITRPSTPQIEPSRNIQPQIAKTEDPYHHDQYHQEPQGDHHHQPASEPAPAAATPTTPPGTAGAGPATPV